MLAGSPQRSKLPPHSLNKTGALSMMSLINSVVTIMFLSAFLAHAKPISANKMPCHQTSTKITITYTEYVTVYAEPSTELNKRQNDGAWTPDATFQTWTPEPTVPVWTPQPTVPSWTSWISAPTATKAPATEGSRNGMPVAFTVLAIVGAFVGLSLLGCVFFAVKRRGFCCGSKKKSQRKTTTQWFGNRDVEAGSSDSERKPPPHSVVNPGAYPDRA